MKPSPTPAEIDRISANRILSDADLIRAGAVYEGGVLKPTAEQIEAAAKEGPTTSRLGMLALHSDADQELSRGQEVFTAAALNRLNLAHRLEQALEPYAAIFADKLPAPDSNERSILRKIKAKERRLPTWTAKRDLDGVEVNYRFKLRYLPGEDYNQLTSAKIELRDELNEDRLEVSERRTSNAIDLTLNYEHARLADIDMSGPTRYDAKSYGKKQPFTTATLMNGGGLSSVLTAYGFGHIYLGDQPALRFYEDSQAVATNGYEFDADSNRFRYKDENGASRPEAGKSEILSVDEFIDIVEGYLSLIPTRELG